jgi:hypothetical protein
MTMKGLMVGAAMILLAGTGCVAQAGTASEGKEIHAQGCVQAGVENRCLLVTDAKSGKLYNILIKGPRPALGDGIEFTGVPFEGVSVCMQGIAVKVTNWARKDSLKCTQGEAPRQ